MSQVAIKNTRKIAVSGAYGQRCAAAPSDRASASTVPIEVCSLS